MAISNLDKTLRLVAEHEPHVPLGAPDLGPVRAAGRIVSVIMNVNMGKSHDGLSELAKQFRVDPKKLEPGQYLVFINTAKNRIKVFTANSVIAYLRLERGQQLAMETIRLIPQAFRSTGTLDYDAALKEALLEIFRRRADRKQKPVERADVAIVKEARARNRQRAHDATGAE